MSIPTLQVLGMILIVFTVIWELITKITHDQRILIAVLLAFVAVVTAILSSSTLLSLFEYISIAYQLLSFFALVVLLIFTTFIVSVAFVADVPEPPSFYTG